MASARNVGMGAIGLLVIGLLGGNVLSSVLSSRNAPAGSVVTSGNIVLVTANRANSNTNVSPSIVVDSGAVKTFAAGSGIPGGGIRMAGSGANILQANALVPTAYASGATLDELSVECNNAPVATSGSIVINRVDLNQSKGVVGTVLRNGITIGTGSYTKLNSGAILNTKMRPNTYLSFIATSQTAAGSKDDCVIKPTFHEKYGR